ncbi:hypothetical protein C0993_010171, partial [Termitomyces sp. T159_Od127]
SILDDKNLRAYMKRNIFEHGFNTVNDEYRMSSISHKRERVHGDAKTKFGSKYCMSIILERVPRREGGGHRRVIGLHAGTMTDKDSLISQVEFGDKVEDSDEDTITGLMFRTALLQMMKGLNLESVQDRDVNDLSEDID